MIKNKNYLKIMTVLGTRPEIIKLSRTMALLDQFTLIKSLFIQVKIMIMN